MLKLDMPITVYLFPIIHNSLDFINYGDGNINCYLQSGAPGIGTGDFHWHNNDSVMMSLTYEGNLGLGITNPSQRLNVQGISTFSDDAFFSGDVFISGNLTISSLNVSSMNTNVFGNVTGDIVFQEYLHLMMFQ